MTRWGIGPRFGILTALYSLVVWYIHSIVPMTFSFDFQNEIGLGLIILGFCIFIYPAVTIDKYFNNKELRTSGLYSICRHPIYGAWIAIIIPGIVIYWGSWFGLSIPIFAYLVFSLYIHIEEDYLTAMFPLYKYYKRRVNAIFPKIF